MYTSLLRTFSMTMLFMLTFPSMTMAVTTPSQPNKKQLKTIQHSIDILNKDIKKKQVDELKLQKNLVQTETAIHKITEKIVPITQRLQNQQHLLTTLEQQRTQSVHQLEQQQDAFAKLMVATYVNHEHNHQDTYLRLLLSQDSMNQLSRFLMYYRYFHDAKMQQLSEFQQNITRLEHNHSQTKHHTQLLEETKLHFQSEDQKLKAEMRNRQELLKKLRVELKTDTARLQQLKKDAQNLEHMLQQLAKQQALARQRYVNPKARPFNHHRGHMVWPAQGNILHQFGSPLENSEMRWKGVLIAAKPHQPVKAVADGKVIFAEFLRGYGLLIIIDHGQNYLTLYGRNQSLYKKVGDLVKAGEIVAQVGQATSYDKSGLYFEVRYKGQPIDPLRWLSMR